MSDFIAIVNVGGKVLHLVDWDRPVWFLADNPNGSRIIPRPKSFLTDALVFFASEEFGINNPFKELKKANDLIDLNTIKDNEEFLAAFKFISKIDKPWIFIATFGRMDKAMRDEIDRISIPVITSEIDVKRARELGIG